MNNKLPVVNLKSSGVDHQSSDSNSPIRSQIPDPKSQIPSLTIAHLYPKEMNIYGDMGNIIALTKRCEWRGIEVKVVDIEKGENSQISELISDIYFMGGGQDNDMFAVFEDLLVHKKEFIRSEIEKNKVFLLICGGFELFGKYFLDSSGRTIEGLDFFPIETRAPGNKLEDRCLGNLVYELHSDLQKQISQSYKGKFENTVVGFENHSGQVFFLKDSIKPIGKVLSGKGNNSLEGIEGANIRNVFGSFTHGSLLPKNPHFADLLISKALKNKYGEQFELSPLDDEIEWSAHKTQVQKIISTN